MIAWIVGRVDTGVKKKLLMGPIVYVKAGSHETKSFICNQPNRGIVPDWADIRRPPGLRRLLLHRYINLIVERVHSADRQRKIPRTRKRHRDDHVELV